MTIAGAAAAGVIIAGAAGGGAYAIGHSTGEKAADAAGQSQTLQLPGGSSGSGSSGSDSSGGFGAYGFGQGNGTDGSSGSDGSSGTGTTPSDATSASATEKQGVVTIVSTLDYNESSKSAGTGMVMTSDGEILTNNHVVQGATSIQVTVVSTGKTYTAKVVGTDATNDVAVLKLEDASGLQTVSFGENDTVAAGDTVHSTGNAEGTGSLVTAKGTVLATDQSITVQSESGSGTESLKNLIEVSADVVSGDSGGPLRNADGDVIGIITAASSGTSDTTGYAIPISSALSIASNILDGNESGTIQIGLPAFLGAQISSTGTGSGTGTGTTGSGVTIAGTVSGSAAAKAGLVAGDTITAIDSKAVTDADSLTSTIQSYNPGDSVKVTYTDANGASKTVTVTLGEGPAA
ncbi:trypsin-like peptidase domain-containing protein [Frondihabitans sp. VKM Ac-2883]|nr:trypsin-like peptidase domain-containing protein [Frondihabitans sp. VKM Ac-2883]